MNNRDQEKEANSSCLTLNGLVYKTSGNILFYETDETYYFMAESPMLEKIDQAIEGGILQNGMCAFLKKLKDVAVK
jgi:hypothetical protein